MPRRCVLAALLLCVLAAPARTQVEAPPERRKSVLEGTHAFRRILFDQRCDPLEDFDDLNTNPSRTILIVLGDLNRIERIPGGLERFLRAGGAVLLATDRPVTGVARNQLLAVAGYSIAADSLVIDFNGYKGLPYCPLLVAEAQVNPQLLADPLTGEWLQVATNVPAHLRPGKKGARPGISVLARLPVECYYEKHGPDAKPEDRPAPFLVGGNVGKGRILLAADHSVFINEMMLPDDNNNVEFSTNCVRWLRGDAPRDRVLFLDEAGVQTTFDIPLKSANLTFEELAELAFSRRNQILKGAEAELVRIERSNAPKNLAARVVNAIDSPQGRLFALLALLLSLALMVFGLFRLGIFARFYHDRTTPILAAAVGRTLPAAPLVDQRNYALLRLGNLNEPAGDLARRWLVSQGVAVPVDAGTEPPVAVRGGWWQGRKLRARLARVWLLALGRSRERVQPAGLWALQRELEALAAARGRGEWDLVQG